MSLYVFEIRDSPYVKMGFTSGCPWVRVSEGFWSNVHPTGCCNKLGWGDLTLVALFEGSLDDERSLQEAFPPERGEFWATTDRDDLLKAMREKLVVKELPPKPASPPDREQRWCEERLICCLGGRAYKCFECEKVFSRHHLLLQHKASHSATAGRVTCHRCGLVGLKRNIVCARHRDTTFCKSKSSCG
jgi:hypothetical protein